MVAVLDTRRALLALLNSSADQFLATYGWLRGLGPQDFAPEKRESSLRDALIGPPYTPTQTIERVAELFRLAISIPKEPQRIQALNLVLGRIFESPVTIDGTTQGSALTVDILAGTVEPRPRDLLDALASELMHSRKALARCALCSKFFYRQWNKDRYCSPLCGDEARRRQQADWVAKDRANKKPKTKKGCKIQ